HQTAGWPAASRRAEDVRSASSQFRHRLACQQIEIELPARPPEERLVGLVASKVIIMNPGGVHEHAPAAGADQQRHRAFGLLPRSRAGVAEIPAILRPQSVGVPPELNPSGGSGSQPVKTLSFANRERGAKGIGRQVKVVHAFRVLLLFRSVAADNLNLPLLAFLPLEVVRQGILAFLEGLQFRFSPTGLLRKNLVANCLSLRIE